MRQALKKRLETFTKIFFLLFSGIQDIFNIDINKNSLQTRNKQIADLKRTVELRRKQNICKSSIVSEAEHNGISELNYTFDCSNRAGDEQENSSSSPNNSGVSLYGIREPLTSSIYKL